MELKEAKKIADNFINVIASVFQVMPKNLINIDLEKREAIAIKTVLQALEELQKENEKLKKERDKYKEAYADYQDLGKEFSKLQDKLDYKDYCLDNIIGLGFDYEGCEVEGCKPVDYLKELIDELVEEAKKGLACDENDEEMKEVLKWIHEGKHSEGYLEKMFEKEGDHIPRID